MLNSRSPIPLYHQLADILLNKIRSGEYASGARIPSENSLAAKYNIGRPTARQATDILVRKGILKRKRGSGTFVCEPRKEIDLFSLDGTILSFQKKGVSVRTRIQKKIRLKSIGDDPENPFSNKKAYFFSRISSVGKIPVLIEDIYLHETLFSGIDRLDLAGQSISHIVRDHYYMQPYGGKQNFRIGHLTGKRALTLNVTQNTPILIVKRFLNFAQAKNAVYSELICRTDQFVFSQTIGGIPDD